jgi:WD40 repeat protein
MLVTGGDDDTVCLWNVSDRTMIKCFKGHEDSITAVAFTPDGNYLISGSSGGDSSGELLVWDAQFGHGKFLTRVPDSHDLGVQCCEFSPTYGTAEKPSNPHGRFLMATGGKDNLVKLWIFKCEVGSVNVSIGLDTMLPGHKDSVLWLRFSPDGKYIASCSLDKTARLWNVETKQVLISIDEHSSYVASCAFSCDSKFLATASNDCTVKIWQLNDTSQIMYNLNGYEEGEETTSSSNTCLYQCAIESWSVEDVCNWLISLDLGEHGDKFRTNAINGRELLALTSSDLKTVLDIPALGHRNQIVRARDAARQAVISSKHVDQNVTPEEFLCPITHELMKDPVIASDGYTYDRPAIVSWITREQRSPMTNSLLASTEVIPNRTLKMMIQKFLDKPLIE